MFNYKQYDYKIVAWCLCYIIEHNLMCRNMSLSNVGNMLDHVVSYSSMARQAVGKAVHQFNEGMINKFELRKEIYLEVACGFECNYEPNDFKHHCDSFPNDKDYIAVYNSLKKAGGLE